MSENLEQAAVVSHRNGPMVVLAGAGSGKTRAMIHRAAELEKSGVDPERILMVTFSAKAAGEMRARLRRLGSSVEARTWHSLCGKILRDDRTEWKAWKVDEKNKAAGILKAAVGYKHLNWVGADVGKIRSFIGKCKASLFEPDSEGAAELARGFGKDAPRALKAFAKFQELIEEEMLLTFDDMLVFAARHLAAGAAEQWAARYDHLVQDEAQDENLAQKTIGHMLALGHGNYTVVGDPAQAIYSFRGSTPEYLMKFREEWPCTTTVNMNRNYRSGRNIIAVANVALQKATAKLDVPLVAERDIDGKVRVLRAADLEDEASAFVAYAKAAHAEHGCWNGTTCLFRLNAQSRALEDALIRARIPYVLVGGSGFYERKEVKDLLAYLRVATGHGDVIDAVRRSLNAPFRYLGAAFVEKVQDAWEARPGDALAAIETAANQSGTQKRQFESAKEWCRFVSQAKKDLALQEDGTPRKSPREVLDEIVRASGYLAWLEKEEGEESIESSHVANVRELIRLSDQFPTAQALLDYIDETIRAAAKQREDENSDAILLMSVHRSKGLEWPRVWVVGCNEKILPHAMGDAQEERRIFYVAVTRAMDELTLSYVSRMAMRAGVREIGPSPFIEELKAAGSAVEWLVGDAGVDDPPEPDLFDLPMQEGVS